MDREAWHAAVYWVAKSQTLQCSCLENPRDGGASWATVYGVAQSQTLGGGNSNPLWYSCLENAVDM